MGKLITFEGIDCCGKTTQINRLVDWLGTEKHAAVTYTREPGGSLVSEWIRSLLLNPATPPITDVTEALLFAASRSEHFTRIIKPSLVINDFVISDRFCDSSIAYQSGGRGIDPKKIEQINDMFLEGFRPDVTFYLQIPVEEMEKRIANRDSTQAKDRIEKENRDFFVKVIEMYDWLANEYSDRIVTIDGTLPVDEIQKVVRNVIQSRYMNT